MSWSLKYRLQAFTKMRTIKHVHGPIECLRIYWNGLRWKEIMHQMRGTSDF